MKKLSAGGSGYLGVKMATELRSQVAALATESGASESAIVRACVLFTLPILRLQPDLVRVLDSGGQNENFAALLERTRKLSEKTGARLMLVLRAALRHGLFAFEQGGDEVKAEFLQAVEAGLFEMPSFQKALMTTIKSPRVQTAVEASVESSGFSESVLRTEAEAQGILPKPQAAATPPILPGAQAPPSGPQAPSIGAASASASSAPAASKRLKRKARK